MLEKGIQTFDNTSLTTTVDNLSQLSNQLTQSTLCLTAQNEILYLGNEEKILALQK